MDNILRDDGLSYGDYVEQLTFFLFLKMAHERSRALFISGRRFQENLIGRVCSSAMGDELETHYRHVLESLNGGKRGRESFKLGREE